MCVCLCLYLLHSEDQILHSILQDEDIFQSDDILAGLVLQLQKTVWGLRHGFKVKIQLGLGLGYG